MRSVSLFLFAALAAAQHEHHPSANSQPAKPMAGLGNHHHPVSTTNAEAQKFFDQGFALIYAFNHEESAKAFQRAAELDPKLAMAWWGYALAVGPNYNEPAVDPARMKAAVEAMDKAKSLAGSASEPERAYIDALATRFTLAPNPDVKQLGTAYSEAMKGVYERLPDDPDAAVLYADSLMNVQPWQLWDKAGKPLGNTAEIVRILEATLKRWPDHVGANHLYIHAVEASRTPDRANVSAGRLGKLAPGAGHLVHMPSHIYIRTGEYEAAAKSNTEAAAVDRAYIKATGANGAYPAMYYSHNLHFLAESYSRAGNYKQALAAALQLEANVKEHIGAMPMVEGFLPFPSFVQLRFGKWQEALQRPEPPKEQRVAHVFWQYARGMALAGLGRVSAAQEAQAAMVAEAKGLPGETPFGLNSAASILEIARHVLAAKIATAQHRPDAALESWRQAVAAEDALNYDEPPGWYYPVRESLGAALLEAGRAAEAETVFREELANNPGNGRSLFGLRASLEAQKKTAEAKAAGKEFAKAWRRADTRLQIASLR
jgi:tetratricopeptide (TPR) repeat protein